MNMRLKHIIPLLLLCFALQAQDIHFSQYYFSPLSLNPANTGNYKGDYRLFGNYRSQWRDLDKGYNTYSFGGDANFFPSNLELSGGLIFINDLSAKNLGVTKIFPSGAWHTKLAGFRLHLGLQPGLVIKSVDFNKHSYPNQLNWEKGYFDSSLPNHEAGGQRFSYFDLNIGGLVSRRMGKFEPELGAAFFHVNNPPESFADSKRSRLPMRNVFNAAVTASVTPAIIAKVHSMYGATTKATDWITGVQMEYVLARDPFYHNSVFVGFMWRDGLSRNTDAGIATIGVNYGPYTLGLSYDVTVSELKTSVDSKGAYEIALIYRAKSSRLTTRVVPCERY
jgi:type IX secretion system PorP/SprF family membrane protein